MANNICHASTTSVYLFLKTSGGHWPELSGQCSPLIHTTISNTRSQSLFSTPYKMTIIPWSWWLLKNLIFDWCSWCDYVEVPHTFFPKLLFSFSSIPNMPVGERIFCVYRNEWAQKDISKSIQTNTTSYPVKIVSPSQPSHSNLKKKKWLESFCHFTEHNQVQLCHDYRKCSHKTERPLIFFFRGI